MAIYIRTRPTTGIKALGYLGTLAAIGIALLYPLILVLAAFALGALDEAVAYPEDNESVANAATVVGVIPAIYSFVLTAIILGATSAFKGEDRWLTKSSTVTHRDIASARFLHVSKDPNSRAVGMLWAMLAGMLLVASPFLAIAIPHALIYSESTQELVEEATWAVSLLITVLFVALLHAAARRRSIAVRMTPRAMSVAVQESSSLALPSSRDDLSIQEVPARWGRVKVQAVYAPHAKGAEQGRAVVIPRLSQTARPSRLDDARSRVEARLDEVWRATQLVRTPPEQEETTTAPTPRSKTSRAASTADPASS